ncbi:hypothetical protein D8S78_08180 [Natrialba swarupiae]|nr:hypothetical protein [Natrialba swarupiae]
MSGVYSPHSDRTTPTNSDGSSGESRCVRRFAMTDCRSIACLSTIDREGPITARMSHRTTTMGESVVDSTLIC